MSTFRYILVLVATLFLTTVFSAEVHWSARREGAAIVNGGSIQMADGEFSQLNQGLFADAQSFSYLRLGIGERINMDYFDGNDGAEISIITFEVDITTYNNTGQVPQTNPYVLSIEYSTGKTAILLDASDFRMNGVHKFDVLVTGVNIEYADGTTSSSSASDIPNFVYMEAGFYAERYYKLDVNETPWIAVQMITYNPDGSIASAITSNETAAYPNPPTNEIFLNWDYVEGAEYYDLEWTWVDNYSENGNGLYTTPRPPSDIKLTEQDFKNNSTRIRTRDQHYSIPNVFAKGYLIYRVRGVGRWMDQVEKDLYGLWSTDIIVGNKTTVNHWVDFFIEIKAPHEDAKNWQYQATYAEDGKKKEVVQYFDGSLRGRQTVTRINSDNQSVVGETIYDNEGRGVVQILPTPQKNPTIKYYPALNKDENELPYSHRNFDWETSSTCDVLGAEKLLQPSAPGAINGPLGAGEYYSANAHEDDENWQQYVPESNGYAFTQVEYTPDNTGRIRNQSGVGEEHQLGSHETEYYYLQPSQEELNRLFGYKVGYMSRYKKNMVIDANGQVSISYLDAQGRVVATSLAGHHPGNLEALRSEVDGNNPYSETFHESMVTNLLNNTDDLVVDNTSDNNDLFSTGRFGAINDGLEFSTQLGVTSDNSDYKFYYDIETGYYEEVCLESSMYYPYVYDLKITLLDDCGEEQMSETFQNWIGPNANNPTLNIDLDDGFIQSRAYDVTGLDRGSYTLHKELIINQEALEVYKADYLSEQNDCMLQEIDFLDEGGGCEQTTCEECADALGTLNEYLTQAAINLGKLNENDVITNGFDYEDAEGNFANTTEYNAFVSSFTNKYETRLEECNEPCQPFSSCDAYSSMMLADLKPGGQYGRTDTDVLSVLSNSVDNGLVGYWRSGSIEYFDEFGNPALVPAYSNGTVIASGGITECTIANPNNGTSLEMVAPWRLTRDDFADVFQPSWATSLLPYHPEYKLLLYAEEICTETDDVPSSISPGTIELTSEEFDNLLRNTILTADLTIAANNSFGIQFTNTTSWGSIYDVDPYFNISYPAHIAISSLVTNDLTGLKEGLMEEALNDDYKGTGLTMLQFAVKTAMYPTNYSSTINGTISTNILDWGDVTGNPTYSPFADQIWEVYRSYYLSFKAEINQYLMDVYGFNPLTMTVNGVSVTYPSMFNGSIGEGVPSIGIAQSFGFSDLNDEMIANILDLWALNSPFSSIGSILGLSLSAVHPTEGLFYDDKEIRMVRIDNLYNSATPTTAMIEDMSETADYEMWLHTGLCPLALDVERLLGGLLVNQGATNIVNATTYMSQVSEMVPDLFTAMTGSSPIIGSEMELVGSISSGNLVITFNSTVPTISSAEQIVIPQIGLLNWTSFGQTGGWFIFSVSQMFPTATGGKVLIKAGADELNAVEYVVEFTTTTLDLDGCEAAFSDPSSAANSANCNKEEEFENAILTLLQNLLIDGHLGTSNFDLSTYPAYQNSVLNNYFGPDATWDPVSFSIVFDLTSNFYLGVNLYTSISYIDMFNGYDIVGNTVYVSYVNSSLTDPLVNTSGAFNYTLDGVGNTPLDFVCPPECDSYVMSDGEFISTLVNEVLTVDENIEDGTHFDFLSSGLWFEYGLAFNTPLIYDWVNLPTGVTFNIYDEANFIYNGEEIIDFGEPCEVIFDFYEGVPCEVLPCSGYYSGEHTIMGNDSEGRIIVEVRGVEFTVDISCTPCAAACIPVAVEPLSCNEEYEDYEAFMHTTFDAEAAASSNPTVAASVLEDEYIGTLEDFCSGTYAYFEDAYEYYIDEMNITSVSDLYFLTIAQFANTEGGYASAADFITGIDAYVSYTSTATNYVSWRDFITNALAQLESPYCPKIGPSRPHPQLPFDEPCWEDEVPIVNAQNQSEIHLGQMADAFVQAYIEGAIATAKENFIEIHEDKEYHYTLYYYDRAGNLVQTVPPKGVDRLEYNYTDDGFGNITVGQTPNAFNHEGALNDDINSLRSSPTTILELGTQNVGGDYIAPKHILETEYRYNSLNQLVYQRTPDGGESRFAYDKLGRLVMSQNDKQLANESAPPLPVSIPQFSYTLYDDLGRVVEVGEMTTEDGVLEINELGLVWNTVTDLAVEVTVQDWIEAISPAIVLSREEVTRTVYDELYTDELFPVPITINVSLNPIGTVSVEDAVSLFPDYSGDNTRNRIVGVVYQNIYDTDINNYDNATFYNYDVHGNVKHLIQVNNAYMLRHRNQHIKHFDYEYDLVSGNVLKVTYQKGFKDQYIHRYHYDADNRITIAETSKDGIVYEKDAKYFYYEHGPLARTEVGEKKVQALDYAYTIQGWLKSVNGEKVSEQTMMGHDGKVATINSQSGRDAFGFSLSYFDDDYAAAETAMLDFSPENSGLAAAQLGTGLYNGNIRTMYTVLSDEYEDAIGTHQTNYLYDQLNRIKSMDGFDRVVATTSASTSGYNSTYSYDDNGNLKTLTRKANNIDMDDFVYLYDDPFNFGNNNRLTQVEDNPSLSGAYTEDIDNQSADNYAYDEIGQLISDVDEDILEIHWKVTNKVDKIVYLGGRVIQFDYDATGNRIAKHVIQGSDTTSTLYVLDAQGNPMSTYSYSSGDDKLYLAERNIYGSSRLGIERVDQEMVFDNMKDHFDFLLLTVNQNWGDLCTEAGVLYVADSGYEYDFDILDVDSDGSTDLLANNNPTPTNIYMPGFGTYTREFSPQIMMNTVVGQTYTITFDVIDYTNVTFTGVYIVNCGGGLIASSSYNTTGTKSISFVAADDITRLKLLNLCPNNVYSQSVISNFVVNGPGDIFGFDAANTPPVNYYAYNEVGDKRYELTDHRGNVNIVVTDRKLPVDDGMGNVDFYTADVVSYADYFPFGAPLPGRNFTSSDGYRYGAFGYEGDSEVKGEGNSYTTEFREYDPRVGRWLSRDPLAAKYSDISPYVFCLNNPIIFQDVKGDSIKLYSRGKTAWIIKGWLQTLTNDKLTLNSVGTIVIEKMGGANPNQNLPSGTALIRELIAHKNTVNIQLNDLSINHSEALNTDNATNGVGSNVVIEFDRKTPTFKLEVDIKTGKIVYTDQTKREITLAHELIHALKQLKGVSKPSDVKSSHVFTDVNGKKYKETHNAEELETVGLTGNQKYTENKIRKEHGVGKRVSYGDGGVPKMK